MERLTPMRSTSHPATRGHARANNFRQQKEQAQAPGESGQLIEMLDGWLPWVHRFNRPEEG